jgi:hypothetical protein
MPLTVCPSSFPNSAKKKYDTTNGITAVWHVPSLFSPPLLTLTPFPLINSTDKIFKSSAYPTETHYLNGATKYWTLSMQSLFNFAFEKEKGRVFWVVGGRDMQECGLVLCGGKRGGCGRMKM